MELMTVLVLSNRMVPDRMTRLQHLHDAGEMYHIPFFDWRRARRAMVQKCAGDPYDHSAAVGVRAEFMASIATRFPKAASSAASCGPAVDVISAHLAPADISVSASSVADMDVDSEVPITGQEANLAGILEPGALQL